MMSSGHEFLFWLAHSRCQHVGLLVLGNLGRGLPAMANEVLGAAQDILHCPRIPASQGAFPDHKRPPSPSFQGDERIPVPLNIAADLVPPERGAGLGPPEE